jgi:hypothetical protein
LAALGRDVRFRRDRERLVLQIGSRCFGKRHESRLIGQRLEKRGSACCRRAE